MWRVRTDVQQSNMRFVSGRGREGKGVEWVGEVARRLVVVAAQSKGDLHVLPRRHQLFRRARLARARASALTAGLLGGHLVAVMLHLVRVGEVGASVVRSLADDLGLLAATSVSGAAKVVLALAVVTLGRNTTQARPERLLLKETPLERSVQVTLVSVATEELEQTLGQPCRGRRKVTSQYEETRAWSARGRDSHRSLQLTPGQLSAMMA